MVRRLKADLRRLGEAFPGADHRGGTHRGPPELELARQLAAYGELRMKRIASLPTQKASMAKLAFVGLQQRLLSSVAAFARTLKVHKATLQRMLDGEAAGLVAAAALALSKLPRAKIAQSLVWRTIELRKLSMRMTTLLRRRRQPSALPTPRKATCAQN